MVGTKIRNVFASKIFRKKQIHAHPEYCGVCIIGLARMESGTNPPRQLLIQLQEVMR